MSDTRAQVGLSTGTSVAASPLSLLPVRWAVGRAAPSLHMCLTAWQGRKDETGFFKEQVTTHNDPWKRPTCVWMCLLIGNYTDFLDHLEETYYPNNEQYAGNIVPFNNAVMWPWAARGHLNSLSASANTQTLNLEVSFQWRLWIPLFSSFLSHPICSPCAFVTFVFPHCRNQAWRSPFPQGSCHLISYSVLVLESIYSLTALDSSKSGAPASELSYLLQFLSASSVTPGSGTSLFCGLRTAGLDSVWWTGFFSVSVHKNCLRFSKTLNAKYTRWHLYLVIKSMRKVLK